MAGRGGGPRKDMSKQAVTTKLFVGNLPETVRKPELLSLFQKYGKVVECDIVKNYAFVHYEDDVEAKAAVASLHESDFMGSNIRVEVSHSKVRQQPGMGGRGECYRCGGDGHWSKDCPRGPKRRGPPEDDFGYDRDPYREPYYRDRYAERDRYPPPPDRYKPYGDPYERRGERRPPPPPPRDPYYRDRERDPYARPPPDYYARRSPPPRDPYPRDPYYDRRSDDPYYDYYAYYYRRPPPPGYDRESPEDGAPPPPHAGRNPNNYTDFTNDEPQFS